LDGQNVVFGLTIRKWTGGRDGRAFIQLYKVWREKQ